MIEIQKRDRNEGRKDIEKEGNVKQGGKSEKEKSKDAQKEMGIEGGMRRERRT